MSIPYRTQQNLKHFAIGFLILAVAGSIALCLWFVWMQRFVAYTRESGAVLDFQAQAIALDGQEAVPPEEEMEIAIHYNEGDDKIDVSTELSQMNGYYLDAETAIQDPEGAWETVQQLPAGTAVLLDVKSIYGYFYYSTDTGRPLSDTADISGMDDLIDKLKNSGYYIVARVPALRDRAYGLENTRAGLPVPGGYLWMDGQGCYWLNPLKEDTVTYLMRVATELRELGFNEVLFDEYCFPDTTQIIFNGERSQALAETAQNLVTGCATDYFAVSFISDGSWTPPTGRSRIYIKGMNEPAKLPELVQNLAVTDPAIRLVFLTDNLDTRFETYSVLRPIQLAH